MWDNGIVLGILNLPIYPNLIDKQAVHRIAAYQHTQYSLGITVRLPLVLFFQFFDSLLKFLHFVFGVASRLDP